MIRYRKVNGAVVIAACAAKLFSAAATVMLISVGAASADTATKMKMTTPVPDEITTPDLVETRIGQLKFFDGFPDDATSEMIYDNLDFMRGVDAFLNAMPGASVEAFRAGLASQGADNNQSILVFENLMDSRSLFLTGNTESIYNLMWLDTKAGPLVIETPPNILGFIDSHWFEHVGDVGNAGPDKGEGGKYLLLPPGYEGEVPDGYFVLRSRTYGNLLFFRGFIENGSTETAVENTKTLFKVYLLSEAENPPPMNIINASGNEFNTIHANNYNFYKEVNDIVQYEPSDSYHPEVLGQLAAIGIEKGKPFAPDERMKKILTDAAAVGNATARTITFKTRIEDAYFFPGSAWFTGFVGGSYEFLLQPGVRYLDARVLFHYYATGITPAMAIKRVGLGSQYAAATVDVDKKPLDGSKTYKVHLPPNIPAKDF